VSENGSVTDLDARYGHTPVRRERQRLLAWIAGIAVAAVFAAWVIWVAFDGTGASMETRDIAHEVLDETTVEVSFELSVAAGTAVDCAIQAQNSQHAIVGWKIVEIRADDRYTRTFTESVRTVEPAVTGLLYRCWLA
jgi:hypothetical protein